MWNCGNCCKKLGGNKEEMTKGKIVAILCAVLMVFAGGAVLLTNLLKNDEKATLVQVMNEVSEKLDETNQMFINANNAKTSSEVVALGANVTGYDNENINLLYINSNQTITHLLNMLNYVGSVWMRLVIPK